MLLALAVRPLLSSPQLETWILHQVRSLLASLDRENSCYASGLELFDSYQQDLEQLLAGVTAKLETEGQQGRAEQRKAVLRRLDMELEEADEIVRLQQAQGSARTDSAQIAQMDIEVSSFTDRSLKPKLQVKLRGYKADLAKRKAEIVRPLCAFHTCLI
jgi:hypothetical protein